MSIIDRRWSKDVIIESGSEMGELSHVYFNPLATNVIYIYGAPILDVSRSHTTTQHSR